MGVKVRQTAADLWRMGEGDVRRELVDGEVIETTPVGGAHGALTLEIGRRLAEHVRRHSRGYVVVGDVGFILRLPWDPERVRAPDVAFIAAERLPGGKLPSEFIEGAPDLAVEVLSPNDNPVDLAQRVRDYLEAGARRVWVVAPEARTVTVYRPDGTARFLREPEVLEGEEVLPGLAIPLAELFGS